LRCRECYSRILSNHRRLSTPSGQVGEVIRWFIETCTVAGFHLFVYFNVEEIEVQQEARNEVRDFDPFRAAGCSLKRGTHRYSEVNRLKLCINFIRTRTVNLTLSGVRLFWPIINWVYGNGRSRMAYCSQSLVNQ
jgi:hypothetical protein